MGKFSGDNIFKGDGAAILVVTIGALIALAFIASFATTILNSTETNTFTNTSVAVPNNGSTTDLTGRTFIGGASILDSTGGDMGLSNLSIITGTGTNGLQSVQLFVNETTNITEAQVNVSYNYEPDGYLQLGSARSIHNLTIIMSALAILVFVMVVFIARGTMGKLIGRK